MASIDPKSGRTLKIEESINANCPWSGEPIDPDSLTLYEGNVVGFCNTGCRDFFAKAIDLLEKEFPQKKPSELAAAILFFEDLRNKQHLAEPKAYSETSGSVRA